LKKTITRLAALAGIVTVGTVAIGTAHAVNPESFLHFAPVAAPHVASTATRSVSFVVRVPRNAFAQRDAMIDVTNISLGTQFNMEMMVGCSNDSGVQGSKSGDWPLSSADDFILQCPAFTNAVAVQGGLGILN
jgi:hypothetical protein